MKNRLLYILVFNLLILPLLSIEQALAETYELRGPISGDQGPYNNAKIDINFKEHSVIVRVRGFSGDVNFDRKQLAEGKLNIDGTSFSLQGMITKHCKSHRTCNFSTSDANVVKRVQDAMKYARNITFEAFHPVTNERIIYQVYNAPTSGFLLHDASSASSKKAVPADALAHKNMIAASSQPASNAQIFQLPHELTSLKVIPLPNGIEDAWLNEYLRENASNYLDASCQRVAYPYLRTAAYWRDVDSNLKIVNRSHKLVLTHDSASAICSSNTEKEAYRTSLAGHPARAFDRMCSTLNSPDSYKGSNLGLVYPTICINTQFIASEEYESCMRTENRTTLKTSGLAFSEYCKCASDRKASYFAKGNLKVSSNTLVKTATTARYQCDGRQHEYLEEEKKWLAQSISQKEVDGSKAAESNSAHETATSFNKETPVASEASIGNDKPFLDTVEKTEKTLKDAVKNVEKVTADTYGKAKDAIKGFGGFLKKNLNDDS